MSAESVNVLVIQEQSKQTVSYAVNYCGKIVFCGICP